MGADTKIQWATHTFNPWRGCTKVAAGCANCYAETQAKRNSATLGVWGPSGTRVVASEAMWRQPVKWNRDADPNRGLQFGKKMRHRVLCGSMCDVFESWPGRVVQSDGSVMWNRSDIGLCTAGQTTVGGVRNERVATLNDVRSRLFRLIDATQNLDWLLLTKRPGNVRRMWPVDHHDAGEDCDDAEERTFFAQGEIRLRRGNVWLGTSIACQEDADKNIPELLKCRDLAAKLFLSIEPLVGAVDLSEWFYTLKVEHDGDGNTQEVPCRPDIDWVIVGGESGPKARPCDVQWIRSIVRQCKAAGVPCFVKQLGSRAVAWDQCADGLGGITGGGGDMPWPTDDKKGGDPSEWPEDIRVREVLT